MRHALIPLALAGLLAGCGKEEAKKPEPVRPVLSVVLAPQQEVVRGYAGTIQPRIQTELGFRVLGRITARDVKVGDIVTRGQRLASVDSTSLELAVQAATANLASATAQLSNAAGAEERQRSLYETRTATQAALESAVQARDSARANVQRARAALDKAQEQLGYATLSAEYDGVVTATAAEVGQIVAPGQAVVKIARPDDREAVVDVPEWQDGIAVDTGFSVVLDLDPSIASFGRVREVAPEADKVTRTRRVLISLISPPPAFRLGTTIFAKPNVAARTRLEIPRSAILEESGKSYVFTVEGAQVRRREVTVRPDTDATALIEAGIAAGARVVVAGVNSLKDGQAIKPPGDGS